MSDLEQWAIEHINSPYKLGANGSEGTYDCWSMIRCLQRDVYQREVPAIAGEVSNLKGMMLAFKQDPALNQWQSVELATLQEGDCLLLTQHTHPHHVGIYLDTDDGGVLHAIEHVGVCFQSLNSLKNNGWIITGVYRYAE